MNCSLTDNPTIEKQMSESVDFAGAEQRKCYIYIPFNGNPIYLSYHGFVAESFDKEEIPVKFQIDYTC